VLIHPNGDANAEKQLKYLNFAGKVMAKCLYDSVVKGSHHLLTVRRTEIYTYIYIYMYVCIHIAP